MSHARFLVPIRAACAAHRKGDSYEKLKPYFEIDEEDLTDVLQDILSKCVRTLNTLDKAFQLGVAAETPDYDTEPK